MTQKNYEGIKIYRQKMKIFELKGKIQRLEAENRKLEEQRILDIMALKTWKKDFEYLRGLLKECYNKFARYQVEGDEPTYQENIEICDKIDAALSESEGQ